MSASPAFAAGRVLGAVGLVAGLLLACPSEAGAVPLSERPWKKGTLSPGFDLGAGSFFGDVPNIGFRLGLHYYLVNGLALGLTLSDEILIYRDSFKARYRGIEEQLPTNAFELTPTLRYVFFRSRWFSPYVFAGVGPVFLNHDAGVHGQWLGGPGVYLNVRGPLYVNVAVSFSGMFPSGRCNDAVTYESASEQVGLDICSFQWSPQLGVALEFDLMAKRRPQQGERAARPEPRSSIEGSRAPIEDEPAEPAEPEASDGAPTDVPAPPS